MPRETGTSLEQFIRSLFFDLQTIDGVKPLEIWNGFRESEDQLEKMSLIKNLYKIVLPLVNEASAGRPFEVQARRLREAVAGVLERLSVDQAAELFRRFPDPPTGTDEQKGLYKTVREESARIVARLAEEELAPAESAPGLDAGVFPDGLFDFRELRIVDNELPFIIFTDKEYRVIRGLALVYCWLVDLESLFLGTLRDSDVDASIIEEFRQFSARVHAENPLLADGRKMGSRELIDYIRVKLQYQDYLDLFERVYRWFEQVKEKFAAI